MTRPGCVTWTRIAMNRVGYRYSVGRAPRSRSRNNHSPAITVTMAANAISATYGTTAMAAAQTAIEMTGRHDQIMTSGSLRQQVKVFGTGFHRVDEQLVPAVEDEHDRLEEPARCVEAKAELTRRAVVIEIRDEGRMLRGLDSVLSARRRGSLRASELLRGRSLRDVDPVPDSGSDRLGAAHVLALGSGR